MAKSVRCVKPKLIEGKFDKVKIGSRFYRAKGKVLEASASGKVTVCPVGKRLKALTSTGDLVPLFVVPKTTKRKPKTTKRKRRR